jgi:hypothetical protein
MIGGPLDGTDWGIEVQGMGSLSLVEGFREYTYVMREGVLWHVRTVQLEGVVGVERFGAEGPMFGADELVCLKNDAGWLHRLWRRRAKEQGHG